MIVRKAQLEDIGVMVDLLLLMKVESPVYNIFTEQVGRIYKTLLNFILSPDVLILILDDGSGMLIGKVEQSFWFEESVAWEEILFVRKEARGTSRAVVLVKAFEDWAKEQGVSEVRLALTTEVTFEKTFDFYERMGYKPIGAFFNKEVRS